MWNMWHMDGGRAQHRTRSARRGADEARSGCELHIPPHSSPKKFCFLFPRKQDETRHSFHSFYFSLAATKGLGILAGYYERTVQCPQSHTKYNPASQSCPSHTFNKDEDPGLHPHLKEITATPFSFPFSSPPPPPFSLSFTHNKISLAPIQTCRRSSGRNDNEFSEV